MMILSPSRHSVPLVEEAEIQANYCVNYGRNKFEENAKISAVRSLAGICFLHVLILYSPLSEIIDLPHPSISNEKRRSILI